MADIVERVAKAIVDEWHGQGFGYGGWDKQPGYAKELARRQARAAIEAMRKPTEAMVEAGLKYDGDYCNVPWTTWQDMIDAALREGAEASS